MVPDGVRGREEDNLAHGAVGTELYTRWVNYDFSLEGKPISSGYGSKTDTEIFQQEITGKESYWSADTGSW